MKVKVCGMRDARNIAEIASLLPDFMGFIFYEGSPRFAEALRAEELDTLSPATLRVGVFVDAGVDRILRTVEKYGLDLVQLHGAEPPEVCAAIRETVGVIKAFGIGSPADLERTKEYEGCCDYFLFDTRTPLRGGSGLKFDHDILKLYEGRTPFLLSGGLSPEDAELLASTDYSRCAGVDINSRFESAPGIKDPASINKFMETIKNNAI